MDMYGGFAKPEPFRIDDLLDLSNEEFFSSASGSASSSNAGDQFPPPQSNYGYVSSSTAFNPSLSTDFTHELCVPSDDVAELEWLSQFVDDSFADYPTNSLTGTLTAQNAASFHSKAKGKRSKATATKSTGSMMNHSENELSPHSMAKLKPKREAAEEGGVRRCTHCASEKTPQWRTGPLGPKTLCNACGVRYKSGQLVPKYRPASSPTFVLTQHSNLHRKVMELRRQKEMMRQQQEQIYRHHHDFRVSSLGERIGDARRKWIGARNRCGSHQRCLEVFRRIEEHDEEERRRRVRWEFHGIKNATKKKLIKNPRQQNGTSFGDVPCHVVLRGIDVAEGQRPLSLELTGRLICIFLQVQTPICNKK